MSDQVEHGDITIETRIAAVPEWLLRAKISSHAKIVYSALLSYAQRGQPMPGYSKIDREWLHKSPSTVSRAVGELEVYRAITVRRDTRFTAGPGTGMITRNTYHLRTSDPQIGHLLPAAKSVAPVQYPTSELVHPCIPSKGLEDLSTTTMPRNPPRSFKAVVVEISEEHKTILGDLLELAAQLRQIRRDDLGLSDKAWSDVNVARAVVEAIAAPEGYSVTLIRAALVALACDRSTNVPQRLKVPGPWWDVATVEVRRQHKAAAGVAREAAIANCPRCDEYGWLLPDVEVKCDHRSEATA